MLGAMRPLAILAFAAAAVLVGVGRSTDNRFLVALGAAIFLLGTAAFFRWRSDRGKVLDREEKTPRPRGENSPGGRVRLALAQMNSVVGDLDGNRDRILELLAQSREARADLVLFPELAVTGYPPEDLLLRPAFVRATRRIVDEIAAEVAGTVVLVGAPHLDADLYNACYVLAGGARQAVYRKRFLPHYGVFDENRYFASGGDLLLLRFGDVIAGPTICEDIWQPGPPTTDLALAGAQIVVNISASPFHVGKDREREEMLRVRAR